MATDSDDYSLDSEQCDVNIKNEDSPTEHTNTNETKVFQCEVCSKVFKRKWDLKVHFRRHEETDDNEQNEKTYSCDQCSNTYKHPLSLKRHMQYHVRGMVKCHVCGKLYVTKSHLRIHMRIHSGERPYECDICHRKFITKTILKSHKSIHDSNRQLYKCNLCDKVLSTRDTLRSHMTIKHSTEEKHQCGLCDRKFKLRYKLTYHLLNYHRESLENQTEQNGQKLLKCHICDKLYLREDRLHIHLKEHTEGPKLYKCKYCGKEVKRKNDFDRHEKTHEKVRETYKCSVCDRVYKTVKYLQCHMKEIHSTEKKYQCVLCKDKFQTYNELRNHRRRHEKEQKRADNHRTKSNAASQPAETNSSKNVCQICHLDCSVEGLEAHMLTHDVKPFKCQCSGVFFSETEYKKHLKNDCEAVKSCLEGVQDANMQKNVKEELEIGFEGIQELKEQVSPCDVKPLECECFMVFFNESEYKKHIKDDCELVKSVLEFKEGFKVENDVKEEVDINLLKDIKTE